MEESNMVSIAFSSFLLFSTFTNIKLNPTHYSLRTFFLFLSGTALGFIWTPYTFHLTPGMVWAEGVNRSISRICFRLQTHTNTRVHTATVTHQWTHTQSTPVWHHIHTCKDNFTHVKAHKHTWTHKQETIQYSDDTKHNTQTYTRSIYTLGKHTHYVHCQTTIYVCITCIAVAHPCLL